MRKSLLFTLILGTLTFGVPYAEAKTSTGTAMADPQIRVQIGRNRNRYRRPVRSYIRTRTVWIGRRRYRETYRITYLPNGHTRIHVISRVPLGRRW